MSLCLRFHIKIYIFIIGPTMTDIIHWNLFTSNNILNLLFTFDFKLRKLLFQKKM